MQSAMLLAFTWGSGFVGDVLRPLRGLNTPSALCLMLKTTMNIKFTYRESLDFSEEEKDFLENKSTSFGQVEIKPYSSSSGASDLVSIVKTTIKQR